MQTVPDLLASIPQVGRLEWIGLSPARRQPLIEPDEAVCRVGTGLDGDHHSLGGAGKRQVTLIQAEHLPAIAATLTPLPDGSARTVTPATLRRNLCVAGFPLTAVKDRRFRVGEVLLEGTGLCHPCSRMEETFGPGGYNAVRGHGGITARVLEEGTLRIGDAIAAA
ncbi:MOSC domain-containing protein [Alienimonas californiensis]|uniref:MOSC domain protein n=1 Tax=Alienimonas californiensis TaxID=2527989 RepID=A0A517PDC4_9PLAN|nr:MOSC domain protein [Alienimonas californiensis]